MNRPAFLKGVPLFRGLPQKDLDALARLMTPKTVGKGETIFSKGTFGDTLYVVVEGIVKIFSASESGKSKTFAFLGPRDFFGEMALLVNEKRSASAVAMAPCELLTLRRKDFQPLLHSRNELALALLNALCARLRLADREIESLSFNSVLGRLACALLELADRYGEQTPSGVRIQLEISHQELAEMAGTAREMATRVLNRFIRTNCMVVEGRYIVLTDREKLRGWIL